MRLQQKRDEVAIEFLKILKNYIGKVNMLYKFVHYKQGMNIPNIGLRAVSQEDARYCSLLSQCSSSSTIIDYFFSNTSYIIESEEMINVMNPSVFTNIFNKFDASDKTHIYNLKLSVNPTEGGGCKSGSFCGHVMNVLILPTAHNKMSFVVVQSYIYKYPINYKVANEGDIVDFINKYINIFISGSPIFTESDNNDWFALTNVKLTDYSGRTLVGHPKTMGVNIRLDKIFIEETLEFNLIKGMIQLCESGLTKLKVATKTELTYCFSTPDKNSISRVILSELHKFQNYYRNYLSRKDAYITAMTVSPGSIRNKLHSQFTSPKTTKKRKRDTPTPLYLTKNRKVIDSFEKLENELHQWIFSLQFLSLRGWQYMSIEDYSNSLQRDVFNIPHVVRILVHKDYEIWVVQTYWRNIFISYIDTFGNWNIQDMNPFDYIQLISYINNRSLSGIPIHISSTILRKGITKEPIRVGIVPIVKK